MLGWRIWRSAFPYRGVTHNLSVNSPVWMNYVGLIGDPREPNSNSLQVCVEGLEEGPLYCSAQLAGCCFNGRWEINGDLMTVGRTQCNNRVLVRRRPSTLVSQDNYPHGCTHTHTRIRAYVHKTYTQTHSVNPQTHKHIHVYRRTQSEHESDFYWFVSKEVLQSSAISAPRLITSTTNGANSQPANPPVWQKTANLCIGDVVCEE